MRNLRAFLIRFATFFRRQSHDDDFSRELDSHLAMHIDENLRRGMTPAEARRSALIKLGGITQTQQAVRDRRTLPFLETFFADLRFAARLLRKNPGFTTVAVLTLALGIGANTAIFSVVDGVLLQPLPYRNPEQLYRIREIVPQMAKSYPLLDANLPDFLIWQKQCRSFSQIAVAEATSAIHSADGPAEEIYGLRASASLLDTLGIRPELGRAFLSDEDLAGRGNVVMLSDAFWQERFHRDPGILGRKIILDGQSNTIVGVLPASFRFPKELSGPNKPLDFYKPLGGPRYYEEPLIGEFDFVAIARLQPGVTPESALAELNVLQEQIAAQAKADSGGVDLRAELFPLAGDERWRRNQIRR